MSRSIDGLVLVVLVLGIAAAVFAIPATPDAASDADEGSTPRSPDATAPATSPPSVMVIEEYEPPRRVGFEAAGQYVGYRFTPTGEIQDEFPHTLPGVSSALASRLVQVGGQEYFLIASGAWEGWYVPRSNVVDLAEEH